MIFAGATILLIGLMAVVIDVSWYWANTLRVQRAADAAALAGAVWLPGDRTAAYAAARSEATKNSYTDSACSPVTPACTTVVPVQDVSDPRQLNVTISAPVGTYFMRVFGIPQITARRTAKGVFVLPVPMGSPLSYYGVGCLATNTSGGGQPQCITVANNSNGPSGVPSAAANSPLKGALAPSQLNSQGFWAVVFTKGGDSRNGDAFVPLRYSGGLGGGGGTNGEYDPTGYGYTVEIPAGGGGSVYLYDPVFCGMPVLGSGRAGTGDEWTGNMNGSNPRPVSTYFNLWNTNNTPYNLLDDVLVYGSGSTFENMNYVDQSGHHGTGNPQYAAGSNGITRCDRTTDAAYAYHLKWWQLPTGALAEGTYRLQVTGTKVSTAAGTGGTVVLDANENDDVGAANRFSVQVRSASGSPRVYGAGRMAAYANIQSGTQLFYLAQIDRAAGAGKSVVINLYDPGDVGGGAWLQILSPNNNTYAPVTFSYTSRSKAGNAGPSGTNVTCVQTNRPSAAPPGGIPAGCPSVLNNTGSVFDSYWLTITVPLASTYGSTGLTPASETQAGWWKIRYTVGGGNDTTTWMVNIRGNPVRLLVP